MRLRALLAMLTLSAAAPAAAAWQEASSKHFLVYSDDRPERVREFAAKLERFDAAMRVLRVVPDREVSPNARVTVYVLPDTGAVQRLIGERNVAGFYVPRASQSVAFVPRSGGSLNISALTVLLHEYAHHFTFANWGNAVLPAWLVEGFAEYHSAAGFREDGGVSLGGAAKARGYGLLDDDVMPMQRLLTTSPAGLTSDQTAVFYARAWLLTHYLTSDTERRRQLGRYLTAINAGKTAADAAAELGKAGELDQALNAYARRGYVTAFLIPGKSLSPPAVAVRALTAGEAAVMPARILSVRGVDRKTAAGVVERMRRLAAPFPADAGAQNALAEAEYDAGDYAAAAVAAQRALAADPKSVHAMMYAGLSAVATIARDTSTGPDRWRAARAWYTRANRADTEYAWPLQMFYFSFAAARQEPTANAQAGLIYARELAPFDAGLGMTAAYVLLRQDKPRDAATVLKPIAYNVHGGTMAAVAAKVLAAIDAGGSKAALAVMQPTAARAEPAAASD